jgi:biotin carboxylase
VNAETRSRTLPLLAVVYGSLSLEQPIRRLAEAAHRVGRILWVLPFDHKDSRAALRLSKAQGDIDGDILDVSGMTPSEAAEAIGAHHPQGITCFIDETIAWTAEVADLLGLPFHTPRTAVRLTDKLHQRMALAEYGLRTPGFWNPDDLVADDDDAVAAVVRSAPFPLVLKPRRGTSSQDTETIGSESELRRVLTAHDHGRMLIESYIPDPTTPCTGAGSAPYVSVEILVSDGVVSVLGVTGRMPLAEPFRETGQYFPADTTAEARASFAEAATAATRALGITTGVLHVEVKCTDDGPVIIEVNGRPGGGSTCDFIQRAHGLDLIALTMRVALGVRIVYESLPLPREVLFRLDVQPDARLRRITAIEGLDAALRIPGVEQVTAGMEVGDAFSWRRGTFARVAVVTGAAPDHESARRARAEVLSTIKIEGTE